jgi:hypothetical protein
LGSVGISVLASVTADPLDTGVSFATAFVSPGGSANIALGGGSGTRTSAASG